MRSETVSCIVPAHNAERFLRPALRSIFEQTHAPYEVIVVDDGSSDGTAAIARALGDRVRLVQTENRGALVARDRGLAAASGDWVAFLDADDLWRQEKTEVQLRAFCRDPEIDLCVGHFENFWEAEVAEERDRYRDHQLSRPSSGYIVPALLAPRGVFERFGGFSSEGNRSETGWFARAVARGAKVETLPDVVLDRRLHRSNDSRVNPSSSIDGLFDLIQARRRREKGPSARGS